VLCFDWNVRGFSTLTVNIELLEDFDAGSVPMLSLAHVTLATHRHHVYERLLALGDTFLLDPVGLCFPVEAAASLACRWFYGLRVSQIIRQLNGAGHRGQMT